MAATRRKASELIAETENGFEQGRENNFRVVMGDLMIQVEMAESRISKLTKLIEKKKAQMEALTTKWDNGLTDDELCDLRREWSKDSVHNIC